MDELASYTDYQAEFNLHQHFGLDPVFTCMLLKLEFKFVIINAVY